MKPVARNGEAYRRARRNMLKAVVVAAAAVPGVVAGAKPANALHYNCFLKGTRILTADGERKIEDLSIGDLLPTVFGGTCPIQWIGRHRLRRTDPARPWIEAARPVRVVRSAIAENVPSADLCVTRHHALLIDGVLVPAGYLVNGVTITLFDPGESDEMEFFHIKLAAHDVIFAEGAPCESLLQVDEKASNFADYFRAHGASAADEKPCAPGVGNLNGRGELKSRIRSAMSPWIDRRRSLDIIRDRVDERAVTHARQSELVS